MASHRVKPYVGKFSTAVLLHLRWTVARSGTCFGSQRNLLSTLASARKLELEEYFMPAIRLTGGSWNEVGANRFEHRFVADFTSVVDWYQLPAVPLASIQVLTHVQYVPGG